MWGGTPAHTMWKQWQQTECRAVLRCDPGMLPPRRICLQAATVEGGRGGRRELSAARMHLRGLLKQAAQRWEDHVLYKELQEQLALVERGQAALN